MKKCNNEHHRGNHKRGKGPSSFGMHDSKLVFEKINLQKGDVFADLGCGIGDYSFFASQEVGEQGKIYAVDNWAEMLESIKQEAENRNIKNIATVESDLALSINLEDNCANHCLLATVMHAQKISEDCQLFPEIARILKPGGQLAIIECKKEEMPFGPPLSMRVSPEELEKALFLYGFQKTDYVDLGYNYLILFQAQK